MLSANCFSPLLSCDLFYNVPHRPSQLELEKLLIKGLRVPARSYTYCQPFRLLRGVFMRRTHKHPSKHASSFPRSALVLSAPFELCPLIPVSYYSIPLLPEPFKV